MTFIYHMADKEDWAAARHAGFYAGTANDKADGFIHFSTGETVVGSAAKHRAGQENLILLTVDSDALGDALKWEPARGGILFPHLYGLLDPALVLREEPLPLGPDGLHIFPAGIKE
ncbi:DUF952 domain-containing protein [Sneathiella chinensis]|uniref:Glutathione S-transferase n=1 Tax=Sneathiella chinensis TaxID=349750 RepID=A0ABQ5U9R1_9PROT|nr:DUF952 domain-containing protein [Sneathiella chinensis]GLQ07989.1 hypothetical protein GCM10007924_32110 [Sneathiella chinensis]